MEIMRAILKNTNAEDVTDRELDEFRHRIEEAMHRVNKMQAIHRSLTGVNYVPPIRLASQQKDSADKEPISSTEYWKGYNAHRRAHPGTGRR